MLAYEVLFLCSDYVYNIFYNRYIVMYMFELLYIRDSKNNCPFYNLCNIISTYILESIQ